VPTISIEDAQAKLAELIRNMAPGEELIITAGNQPVARLTNTNGTPFSTSRQPLKLS
jgi:prevent-host-death family protein